MKIAFFIIKRYNLKNFFMKLKGTINADKIPNIVNQIHQYDNKHLVLDLFLLNIDLYQQFISSLY